MRTLFEMVEDLAVTMQYAAEKVDMSEEEFLHALTEWKIGKEENNN